MNKTSLVRKCWRWRSLSHHQPGINYFLGSHSMWNLLPIALVGDVESPTMTSILRPLKSETMGFRSIQWCCLDCKVSEKPQSIANPWIINQQTFVCNLLDNILPPTFTLTKVVPNIQQLILPNATKILLVQDLSIFATHYFSKWAK